VQLSRALWASDSCVRPTASHADSTNSRVQPRRAEELQIAIDFSSPLFWTAVLQIIAIDVVLGGDNAVVIALACRRLPEARRNFAIFWGVFGAIGVRVALISFALYLLAIPYLKLAGAALLLWIGVKLLQPESSAQGHAIDASATLYGAIKTIVVADAVMSLDNVIAIAGAARDSVTLVVFGLIVSVPIIVWGSKLIMRLMDRFPIVVVLGAALIGWIAGDMVVTDRALTAWLYEHAPLSSWLGPLLGAAVVVLAGRWLHRRVEAHPAPIELTVETADPASVLTEEKRSGSI
jgi:YjbE family integral membrane protein